MCTLAISVQYLVGDGNARSTRGFKGGLQIGGRRITSLRYADDIILIATSEDELQELESGCMKQAFIIYQQIIYDLLINVHKTKTMVSLLLERSATFLWIWRSWSRLTHSRTSVLFLLMTPNVKKRSKED